ncbi:Metallothionein-2 like [Actinidia chinensis var. chinensis]|uniref:Metallothionein-2 like n=1 Tax=Actinidia chinensis var. chinensis TaxID=1590841 RepID=A0A2R6RUM7_ACTCC|nr:Metallothionein-2 like [Actinidia chinensis var. chinensis]
MEVVVKSVNEKNHVAEVTKTAALYTGRTAVSAANAVVNSSYFARGTLWASDVFTHAANATADLANRGVTK